MEVSVSGGRTDGLLGPGPSGLCAPMRHVHDTHRSETVGNNPAAGKGSRPISER